MQGTARFKGNIGKFINVVAVLMHFSAAGNIRSLWTMSSHTLIALKIKMLSNCMPT